MSRFGASPRLAAVHAARSGIPLSLTAVHVLGTLQDRGPLPLSDLAARCHLALPPLSRLIAGLEEQGLVGRRPHPQDGRSTLVHVTEDGLLALSRFGAANAELLDSALARWSDDELSRLADQMMRLIDDLRAGGSG